MFKEVAIEGVCRAGLQTDLYGEPGAGQPVEPARALGVLIANGDDNAMKAGRN